MRLIFKLLTVLLFCSCLNTEKEDLVLTFYMKEIILQTSDFSVCKDGRFLYFLLKNEEEKNQIFEFPEIQKIDLSYKNNKYTAKPLAVFSSLLPDSQLNFLISNEIGKLDYYENKEGKWFFLSENIDKTILNRVLINQNSCNWEGK